MSRWKMIDPAKGTPPELVDLQKLAKSPRTQPGRELSLREMRQRLKALDGEDAALYAELIAIKEGKVKVWQPSTAPLPQWFPCDGGIGFACMDPVAQAFAVAVSELTGFSIPKFDTWMDTLGVCGAREELMIRRKWLADAVTADSEDAAQRHVEWMHLRRMSITQQQAVLPALARDAARQVGTRKLRGSRKPQLDEWLRDMGLEKSNDVLWERLPSPEYSEDLYRDGDSVVEISASGRERSIGRAGFDKRLAKLRKQEKDVSN